MDIKNQNSTHGAEKSSFPCENLQEKEIGVKFAPSEEIVNKDSNKQTSSAMATDKYIRFDWAAKKILRDKSNFCILEGLITVLLGESVHIIELLESESNQFDVDDKYNRVDIKAKNSKDEIIIVEIQLRRELYYQHSLFRSRQGRGFCLSRTDSLPWSHEERYTSDYYKGTRCDRHE